ncbi:ATP-binding protein, partial [Pseudomonadota bacterium]
QKILRTIVGKRVSISYDLEDKLWLVTGDRNKIDQVIINLVINARDAIEEDEGAINVGVKNIFLEDSEGLIQKGIPFGAYVNISISDSGSGIPPEITEKIFEPFFTTKGEEGTGLGLATVYGIVKQHNGFIEVHSELNKGTTFDIYLPSILKSEGSDTASEKAAEVD